MMECVCPKCGGDSVYFSKKRQVYVCEDCEHSFLPRREVKAQKIFFSYGHDANEPIILMIKRDLEARGHTIWMDKTEIHGGDDWRRRITDGLIDTSAVISFLSAHSVRSPGVCLDELKIALCVKRGYVRTVLLESEEDVRVPTTVSDVQWLDLSDWRSRYEGDPDEWQAWYSARFAEICDTVESDEACTFTGEIQSLREILRPNLLDTKEQYLLRRQYVGRRWLSDMVDGWLSSDDAGRAFVLIAGPGIGKSCFAANMLHYNPDVLCGIFCEWDKPQTVSARSVVKTIAFKLASKLKDYRRLLTSLLDTERERRALEDKTPEELFSLLITNPLNSLIDGGRGKCLIVIDGLDEAASAEGDRLMRLLADNLRELPSWVRFILTSRPEHSVEVIFREYSPHIIRADNIQNADDIKEYLLLNLREELSACDDKPATLERMLASSQGSFLYASLLVQSVKSGALTLADTDSFPLGLSGFYYHNFKRNYADPAEYREVRRLIELIVAARVLPTELISFFGIDPYEFADAKRRLGSLITESQIHIGGCSRSCISLSHKSMADWLTDRSRACEFYIDRRHSAELLTGKLRSMLADYGMRRLAQEDVTQRNCLCKYIEHNLTSYYVGGELWEELEELLTDADTPFLPYWNALIAFPKDWDMAPMAERLRTDADSVMYFKHLQVGGETAMAIRLLELLSSGGVKEMSLEHFKIFTDLVHLGGGYERAVELDREYLDRYTLDEIIASKPLLSLKTRMLHHSKFFTSSDELRLEVDDLLLRVSADSDCEAYLELLIMGGNLGTLSGDAEYARRCNDEALKLAKERGKRGYELRAVRKRTDLLKLEGRYDEAFELLSHYVSEDSELESRYEVYLLCSLGEMHRHTDNFDAAYRCYERVRSVTEQRGIKGWLAHSLLALGCLMYGRAHYEEALSYFNRARERYEEIGQVWGAMTVELYLMMLELRRGSTPSPNRTEKLEGMAHRLAYRSFIPYIEAVKRGEPADTVPLLFI